MAFFSGNDLLKHVIRVNHAGECAAVGIYRGQAFVLKDKRMHEMTLKMLEHEKVHYDFFDKKIMEYDSSPTVFLPLWKVLAFGLGVSTALLGRNAVATCTVAVEEVIEEHYKNQLRYVTPECSDEVHNAIKNFLADEISHKNLAFREGFIIKPLSKIIKLGCKFAIFLSKHF